MIAGVSIPFVRHCIFLFLFAAAGLLSEPIQVAALGQCVLFGLDPR
jgi:hypothetical protein